MSQDVLDTVWVVRGYSEECGWVYLDRYYSGTIHDAYRKIERDCRRHGITGTIQEKLDYLKWEVVLMGLVDIPQDSAAVSWHEPDNKRITEQECPGADHE
jgi:hypothetical protein